MNRVFARQQAEFESMSETLEKFINNKKKGSYHHHSIPPKSPGRGFAVSQNIIDISLSATVIIKSSFKWRSHGAENLDL